MSTSCIQAASRGSFFLFWGGALSIYLPATGAQTRILIIIYGSLLKCTLRRVKRGEGNQTHTHARARTHTHTHRGSEGSKKGRSEVRGGSAREDDTARGHGQVKVAAGRGREVLERLSFVEPIMNAAGVGGHGLRWMRRNPGPSRGTENGFTHFSPDFVAALLTAESRLSIFNAIMSRRV